MESIDSPSLEHWSVRNGAFFACLYITPGQMVRLVPNRPIDGSKATNDADGMLADANPQIFGLIYVYESLLKMQKVVLTEDCKSNGLDLAGASDVGKKRVQNEDHYLIADLQRVLTIRGSNVPHEDCDRLCSSRAGHLLVVADGMGGHAAGEVASSTAVQSCARYVLDMMYWFLKLSVDNEDDFLDELSECLKAIQRRLWSESRSESNVMGTTVTIAYVLWPRMYVVHAGDSRCYLHRKGQLLQMTTDHTLAQKLVDEGAMTPEDAENSRWRHVLWNCVGGGDKVVQPEVCKVILEGSDTLLLCSDGLSGMVSDDDIALTLDSNDSSDAAVNELVKRANEEGGKDNITVVVARFSGIENDSDASDTLLHDDDRFSASLDDTDVVEDGSD